MKDTGYNIRDKIHNHGLSIASRFVVVDCNFLTGSLFEETY